MGSGRERMDSGAGSVLVELGGGMFDSNSVGPTDAFTLCET